MDILKKFSNPILVAIASGIYPLCYNYYSNFTLIDSWEQFTFLVFSFIITPVFLAQLLYYFKKIQPLVGKNYRFLLTALNLVGFFFFITVSVIGLQKKLLLLVVFGAFMLAFILQKHLRKVVLFQFLLALITGFQLIYYLSTGVNFSTAWKELPDEITSATFVKKPNIYVLQPDGYANSVELSKEPYAFDNSGFETFLKRHQFIVYPDFHSNYTNTVTSNSAMFAMKHHYYKNPKPHSKEPYGLRKSIAGSNAVLAIFKNNTYKTHFITEVPYLLLNRPKVAYDEVSFSYSEIPYLSRGFDLSKDSHDILLETLETKKEGPHFYFIEKIRPGHIAVLAQHSRGKDEERLLYLEKLQEANTWLIDMITSIEQKDPEALIIIVADHGGFVGLNYTAERVKKINNPEIIHSIFSSFLAIKWPDNNPPNFDLLLKSNVNLFRILFAYLSENPSYLEYLEEDKSFIIVREDAPFGVYEVLDEKNTVIFEPKTD